MDTSSEAVQIDVLCAFYAQFDPEKVRPGCDVCNL